MEYVGLYTQQRRNNTRSVILLLLFPAIIVALVAAFCYIMAYLTMPTDYYPEDQILAYGTQMFLEALPWALGIVGLWFVIAYFANTAMIRHSTHSRPLERRENPRVYNIVENLTMACGMPMPQVNVIESPELNAFASGIDNKSYTVTVTTGICDRLDDEELKGVIAHELTHIRNRDTRLLIISIVFVGIVSTVLTLAMRMMFNAFLWGGGSSHRDEKKDSGAGIIVVLLLATVLAAVGYFFVTLTRFAISRKREYMADAGGAELCGNPLALASALEKISANPYAMDNGRDDVQQLFIIHKQSLTGEGIGNFFNNLFSTHPSTESRIKFLRSL